MKSNRFRVYKHGIRIVGVGVGGGGGVGVGVQYYRVLVLIDMWVFYLIMSFYVILL